MKRVALYTLGCKVNQYETQAVSELFAKAGYTIVDFEDAADVYVINTCTVTSMSDRKSRQMLRRAKRLNPCAITVVMGCYAQTAPDEVAAISGVNLVIGTKDRSDIVRLAEALTEQDVVCHVGDIMHTHDFESLSVSGGERTRAYIKVQEGCSQFCSYCIVPYARGPVRSRATDDVVAEARRLADAGYRELVLAGIHIASYGKDLGSGAGLADLIKRIDATGGILRIRLSSIEPMTLDNSFIRAIQGCDKLCPHFHISLQSGCDKTLERMNRKYRSSDYQSIVNGLRAAFADAAITTDVMVGFPGEDEDEFAQSLEFVRKTGFADMHIFAYSPRRGTPAANMGGQVSAQEKHRRSALMFDVAHESRLAFQSAFEGRCMTVLFEHELLERRGYFEGKTVNYITVICKSDHDIAGKLCSVELTKSCGDYMEGRLCPDADGCL